MRTIETLMVIFILVTTFILVSHFAVLPSSRLISSPSLRELARSILETLDEKGELTRIVFNETLDAWNELQTALSAALPPNVVYNLTVYNVVTSASGEVTYNLIFSVSDSSGDLGAGSETASYLVTSPNVTFTVTPQKIRHTLYILNCNDSNGWWITGYTAQTLALDLQDLLSPYFERTILVNSTYQFGLLLDNSSLAGEEVQNAVVINTCGEAVPIPTSYANLYFGNSYAEYCYVLGQRVNQYNWTWVSIVGYPLYYVSNTVKFKDYHNNWGIYGMKRVGPGGLNAFLQGIDNQPYSYNDEWITGSPGLVQFSPGATFFSNYYGLYPMPYQTATRALPSWILSSYNLNIYPFYGLVFLQVGNWIAGATYSHIGADNKVHGAFTAIGLTRIPDIRITALALLMYYHPVLYRSEFTVSSTSRLVVLQLAAQGGT